MSKAWNGLNGQQQWVALAILYSTVANVIHIVVDVLPLLL